MLLKDMRKKDYFDNNILREYLLLNKVI